METVLCFVVQVILGRAKLITQVLHHRELSARSSQVKGIQTILEWKDTMMLTRFNRSKELGHDTRNT